MVKRGSFITSADKISKGTGVPRGTVERILNYLKNEVMIEEQTTKKFRLISVVKYDGYQSSEEVNEEQLRNKRGTSEEQVDTNKNDNNENNEKNENKYSLSLGIEFWNTRQAWNPLNGNPPNSTAVARLLPCCRAETASLLKAWLKQSPLQEEWEQAVKAYVLEIAKRNPANDYCNHRFSMFDFVNQKNGYLKFVNK